MKIDLDMLRNIGFEVRVQRGDSSEPSSIEIYPKNGSSRVYEGIADVLRKDTDLPEREADMMADSFAGQVQTAQVWKVIREDNL